MKSSTQTGLLYAGIHFVIEVTSFFVLGHYLSVSDAVILLLLYDCMAFVPQGLMGYLIDENIRINLLAWGTFLSSAALIMLYFKLPGYPVILAVSLGNAMIHVSGAEATLRQSPGQMTPASLFVSGGSFGLITGKLLAQYHCPISWILLLNLTLIIPAFFLGRSENDAFSKEDTRHNLSLYCYASTAHTPAYIVALAAAVVAVRSFMGYGIPTGWIQTLFQSVLLYVFMGIGKAAGGILIDRIGIRRTALISTLGALPFLIFGDNHMYLSLFGVMLFSMTMAVTLALIVSCMPAYPGVAFGITTIGLFLGMLPMFFFRIKSTPVNIVLVLVLTLLCVVFLLQILPGNTESDPCCKGKE